MEFHLVQSRKENCHYNHIPFDLKGNGNKVFSVHVKDCLTLEICHKAYKRFLFLVLIISLQSHICLCSLHYCYPYERCRGSQIEMTHSNTHAPVILSLFVQKQIQIGPEPFWMSLQQWEQFLPASISERFIGSRIFRRRTVRRKKQKQKNLNEPNLT